MKIEINKAINKAISKSKKLKLWEHMYQMEKEIEELKEKISELEKLATNVSFKLGDLYRSINEETKVSSFKSNEMTDLFKNIKIDDLDLSSMDTTYATNMNKIDSRYLERKKNLMKKEINRKISKGEKLELWEHIYLMVEELKEKKDLRYLVCELKRAEKEIKELKEKIAELKKESKPIWFIPEEDEDFYYVDTYGDVNWNNANGYSDNILKHNQVFKTREEANNHLKVMKAEVSINKRIAELNEGWKPDWENTIQKKYYIFYDNFREILDYNRSSAQFQPNALQLKDKKVARQIIDELEEELKLYLRY